MHSEETKLKLRLARLGKKHSEETKKKISKSCAGINMAENNNMWKGDLVGYKALHDWVRSHIQKPEKCKCGSSNVELVASNNSGKYLRDVNDWEYLCNRCHYNKDIESFKRNKKGQFIKTKGSFW